MFNRFFSVSLTLKAFILTGVAGLLFWFFQDYIQSIHIKKVFNRYLHQELERYARNDWLRLDGLFRRQNQAGKLLAAGNPLFHHIRELEELDWNREADPPVRHLAQRPGWIPGSSAIRGLVHLSHILLLDEPGRIREVYDFTFKSFPNRFLEEWNGQWQPAGSPNRIRENSGVPYLFTTLPVKNFSGVTRAWLVLVTALDEEFLLSFQDQNRSGSIMVFLDQDSGRIMASSRPDLVRQGANINSLLDRYIMMDKSFFDYGFPTDVFVQFATLVKVADIREISESIFEKERLYRTAGHLAMIGLFLWIITWVAGRIGHFTREMHDFSRNKLGLEPRKAIAGGDQLAMMRDQFRYMGEEITRAREREMRQKRETEMANEALRESLMMVKRTQSQLVESEKMASLGGLVAGVAHEINTPIGIGVTAASFLERKSQECHERFVAGTMKRSDLNTFLVDAQESSQMILGNLERAATLIRSFKQVAVDQTSEERRRFILKNYIDDVLISLRPRMKRTDHTVTVRCPETLEVDSFPGAFSQVITNLLVNSLIHGFEEGASGRILFDLSLDSEDRVLFRYSDSGRGMSEEVRKRIFEPFFTTARGQGGSGLGMHIVYNLVTQTLDGSIECESAPGEGVTFTIRFPSEEAKRDE